MNNFGLTSRQINLLEKIFSDFQIPIGDVEVFGSRSMGNYQPHSDIDVVVFGAITQREISRIYTVFAESSMPNKVDIYAYHLIKNVALKKHIDRFAQPLFDR